MNSIINTDNIDYLKGMDSDSVDLVLTDPYFETMSIGYSKATKQDKKSNDI